MRWIPCQACDATNTDMDSWIVPEELSEQSLQVNADLKFPDCRTHLPTLHQVLPQLTHCNLNRLQTETQEGG